MSVASLVTIPEVTTGLPSLTVAQQAMVPGLIVAASRVIAARYPRAAGAEDFTEILQLGADRTLSLSRPRVVQVYRVSAGLAPVLSIALDFPAISRARVWVTDDGDDDNPQSTGISVLSEADLSSGALAVTFSTAPYVQAVADQINGWDAGWVATVAPDKGNILCDDIPALQGPFSALTSPAQIRAWTRDLNDYDLDRKAGTITVFEWGWETYSYPDRTWGMDRRGAEVRVKYQAGWVTVPDDIKQAAIMLIKDLIDRTKVGAYNYEWTPLYAYRMDVKSYQLPDAVKALLSPYKDRGFS